MELKRLLVDGGACVNNLLMQTQADLLGVPVFRPEYVETTALGAAIAAGVSGVFMESHPDPSVAKCDGPNSFPMYRIEETLKVMKELDTIVKKAGFAEDSITDFGSGDLL